ncbi:MAG: glycosyltransferase [Methylovulum sp.]|uniref:glycosyltransferase n=1 Tax=Methylovulum sp. TaxID=1916980 RepID=UPI00262205B9|nr:glycosyltransferase [Methylovulum sp.]MDD2723755.1 glycosyltransferase [Methylovulum sp.]MDD5125256.1 glycosyltransferase [Methylovulum sp.]
MDRLSLSEPVNVPDLQDTPSTISVILIVRNGADYIAEALTSVYQSYLQPLEIIVVDGHSSDDTVAVASQFPKVRIHPQTSFGIPSAYNEGIAQAQGEFIAFISHDDIWLPHKLDIQIAYLQAYPDIGATLGMVKHFLEAGREPPEGFRVELLEKTHPGWIMEALVARRGLFAQVGRFDASFAVGEDSDWFARAIDAGLAPVVLPQLLVRKRIYGGNASLNADTNQLLLRALRASIQRKRAS